MFRRELYDVEHLIAKNMYACVWRLVLAQQQFMDVGISRHPCVSVELRKLIFALVLTALGIVLKCANYLLGKVI